MTHVPGHPTPRRPALRSSAARRSSALVAGVLAAGLALAACAAPDDAGFDDDTATSSAAGTPTDASTEAATDDADGAAAYTVRYTDDHKTVITLDRAQVEGLTGADLGAGGAADARSVLAERATWTSGATADHGDVIAEAAAREGDTIGRVLAQQADGRDVELRLFVKHDQHAHVAHFGEDDGGDD
ncbi:MULTISPECIES: hypothetical protein [unclassified Isoptericola]|uniref:hypothetical protein n=1 Tax=unclassified Isoptericola TaxID=2623355 RepID=UPI00364D84B5